MYMYVGSHQNVANESKGKGKGITDKQDLSQHDRKLMQRYVYICLYEQIYTY
jgi:hypothetical protein